MLRSLRLAANLHEVADLIAGIAYHGGEGLDHLYDRKPPLEVETCFTSTHSTELPFFKADNGWICSLLFLSPIVKSHEETLAANVC